MRARTIDRPPADFDSMTSWRRATGAFFIGKRPFFQELSSPLRLCPACPGNSVLHALDHPDKPGDDGRCLLWTFGKWRTSRLIASLPSRRMAPPPERNGKKSRHCAGRFAAIEGLARKIR